MLTPYKNISTRVETGEEERIKNPDVRTNLDDGGCPDREIAEVHLCFGDSHHQANNVDYL